MIRKPLPFQVHARAKEGAFLSGILLTHYAGRTHTTLAPRQLLRDPTCRCDHYGICFTINKVLVVAEIRTTIEIGRPRAIELGHPRVIEPLSLGAQGLTSQSRGYVRMQAAF